MIFRREFKFECPTLAGCRRCRSAAEACCISVNADADIDETIAQAMNGAGKEGVITEAVRVSRCSRRG